MHCMCVCALTRGEGGMGKRVRPALSRSSPRLRPPLWASPRRGLRRRPFRGPWRFLAAFSLRAGRVTTRGRWRGALAHPLPSPRLRARSRLPRTYLHKDLLDVEPRLGRRVHADNAGVGGVRVGLVGGHGAALAHVGLVARQRDDHGGVAAPLQLLDPRLGALEGVACGGGGGRRRVARAAKRRRRCKRRGRSREVTS